MVFQGGETSGRELTNWQSDLIENTVNPTLARAFNLTSSLTHGRPTNPVLNPKAFLFWSQCATHCHKSLSNSVSSRPHPPPLCVCLCIWVWVQAQLASSSRNLFCSGHFCKCICMKWVPGQGQTDKVQNSAACWSAGLLLLFSLVLLLMRMRYKGLQFYFEIQVQFCLPGKRDFLTISSLVQYALGGQLAAMKSVPEGDMRCQGEREEE